jgi:hypothetical protein
MTTKLDNAKALYLEGQARNTVEVYSGDRYTEAVDQYLGHFRSVPPRPQPPSSCETAANVVVGAVSIAPGLDGGVHRVDQSGDLNITRSAAST